MAKYPIHPNRRIAMDSKAIFPMLTFNSTHRLPIPAVAHASPGEHMSASQPLNDGGIGHARPFANRNKAVRSLHPFQFVQQSCDQACSRCTHRMAQRRGQQDEPPEKHPFFARSVFAPRQESPLPARASPHPSHGKPDFSSIDHPQRPVHERRGRGGQKHGHPRDFRRLCEAAERD